MASKPFWRKSPYTGLLADRYVSGTPLASGHVALSVQALQAALERIGDKENGSTRRILGDVLKDEEIAVIPKMVTLLADCYKLCEEVFGVDKAEKLVPVVEKVSESIKQLALGASMLLPAGWVTLKSAGTLVYIITRDDANTYSLVVCTGGDARDSHPSKPFDGKLKYRTCCRVNRIPRERISDISFWTLTFLMFIKDPPSEYTRVEVIYHVLLPWMAEVTTDHPEDEGPNENDLSSILASMAPAKQEPMDLDLGGFMMAALNPEPKVEPPVPAVEPMEDVDDGGGLGSFLLGSLLPPQDKKAKVKGHLPPRLLAEAFRESEDDPHSKWRTPSNVSSHWKSLWEAVRYLMSAEGVREEALKMVSLTLRKEFLVMAATDLLKCLRPDHPLITELVDRHNTQYKPINYKMISDQMKNARSTFNTIEGDPVTPESLTKDYSVIGVYVGGSWCEPCKKFTPHLIRHYTALHPKGLEVVFLSADKSEEEFREYHSTMPWPACPLRIGGRIAKELGVEGVPSLYLFDAKDGSLITDNGTSAIMKHADTFPWPDRSILRTRIEDDDARLLNLGTESVARKAMKEFDKGALAEGNLHNLHALTDAILRAADAGRLPDSAPIVAKSSEVDLSITPVKIEGEHADSCTLTVKPSLQIEPFKGFQHFQEKNVKQFEGEREDLGKTSEVDLMGVSSAATLDESLTAIIKCQEVCENLLIRAAAASTTSRIVLHFQVVAAIEGLFTKVLTLPRPRDAEGCIWQGTFGTGTTGQKECLKTLHKLMTLYVTVWQSVEHPTRGSDSERFIVVSAILAVFDAVVRHLHGDTDTLLLSALMAEDGGSYLSTRLCQDGRAYEKVAQCLELDAPHLTVTYNAVMGYFMSVKRVFSNELFDWRMPEKIELRKYGATCLFLRKMMERAGYPLLPEDDPNPPCEMEALMNWLTQNDTPLSQEHPEFGWMRDVTAMFRFAATMETRETELLRRRKDSTYQYWRLSFDDSLGKRAGDLWMRRAPGIHWDVAGVRGADMDIADVVITGFGGRELRWGEGAIVQSPTDLERVLGMSDVTEDDVMHCKRLPTYGETLSREESERLMSALTTRYITIPLVLDFFATMDRHTYLFNPGMQALLRAVLFEPGRWSPEQAAPVIPHVPLRQNKTQKKEASVQTFMDATYVDYNESLLGTPQGLLLNELKHLPRGAVLQPLLNIARLSIKDLSAASVYSANAHFMCFLLDLLLDVFGYARFAAESADPSKLQELEEASAELRGLLECELRQMLDRWLVEAEAANDMSTASVLHTFVALVSQHVLTLEGAQTFLGSASYVRNWHGFGLGRLRSDILSDPDSEELSAEQRLLRFLQSQGIDTNNLSKGALDKYVSTTGRSRPLFLHVGRETIRIPTLIRTSADTEGDAQSVKLPPWDLPELKLFRMMHETRPLLVSVVKGADATSRDVLLNKAVCTALRNPDFSYTGWEASGSTDKFVAKRAELQVNVQSCEVLWRNDALRPVPDSMTQFPDYETIFGREPLHCGVIRRAKHRQWVHIVGTEYDLEEWDEPHPSKLGTGFPYPLPRVGETDEQVAKRLQEQENSEVGKPVVFWNNQKRRRGDDEPYVQMDDGVRYEGRHYTRPLDAYADSPHDVPAEDWAVSIYRKVIQTVCPQPAAVLKFPFFLPNEEASADAKLVTLLACDGATEESLTWKEARLYKESKTMEVWMLSTHGRRLFKTLIFSSNTRTSLHNISPDPDKAFRDPLLRFAAGNIKQRRVHGPSLVITKRSKEVGGVERYVAPMLLQGLVSSCFLESYNMWLGEDDIIRGEAIDASSSWFDYILEVHIKPDGTASVFRRPKGAGFTKISSDSGPGGSLFRNETTDEDVAKDPAADVPDDVVQSLVSLGLPFSENMLRHVLVRFKNATEPAVQWLVDDANVAEISNLAEEVMLKESAAAAASAEAAAVQGEAMETDNEHDVLTRQVGSFSGAKDDTKHDLSWLPLLCEEGFGEAAARHALALHAGDADLARHWLVDEANQELINSILSGISQVVVASQDLKLVALTEPSDVFTHELAKLLSGLEDLSHVLVWATPTGEDAKISVIELPRLRLKLQPQRDLDGAWRLFMLDQPGWFVSTDIPEPIQELLKPLPEVLLVQNRSSEYKALVPNHDLLLPAQAGVAFPCRLVPLRTSIGWEEVMEQRFYSYPVHVSNTFLICNGLGPTLYLLLINLLSRRYKEAFRLADGVCTDMELNADEQWIFDQLARSGKDLHPDAVACRLQLSVAVMYSPLKLKWELTEEVDKYLTAPGHVSSDCTLTPQELVSVLRRCPQGTPLIKNHLALLTAPEGEKAEVKPPSPNLPGAPWLKLFITSQEYIDANCTRLERIKCSNPASLADKDLFEFLWSDKLIQDDAGGGGKSLGVGFLFEATKGRIPMKVGNKDISKSLSDMLTRWMHLKLARWGKETVEEGEVEGTMCKQIVQLAHVIRYKNRTWPAFPNDQSSVGQLKRGVDLYKGPGRESITRAFIDALDKEFTASLKASRQPGGAYDVLNDTLEDLRKNSISKTSTGTLATKTRHRPPVSNTSCSTRNVTKEFLQALDSPLVQLVNDFVTLCPRSGTPVSDKLPFTLPEQSLTTPVAQAMLSRLQADVKRYSGMMSEKQDACIKNLEDEASLERVMNGDASAIRTLDALVKALDALQAQDGNTTTEHISRLVSSVNAIPLPSGQRRGPAEYTRRIKYSLDRLVRGRSVVDMPHLAGLFLSTSAKEDLNAVNPYAPDTIDSVTPILILSNRRAHANAVKAAAENLKAMLTKLLPNDSDMSDIIPRQVSGDLHRCTSSTSGAGTDSVQLLKIKHASRSLAELLVQKRWYVGEGGSFDPRFLLFEFIFSIRLRKRQVEMVNWFAENLKNGVSRVQQMIMGQGKTQVVSPLLVLLLADGERLVTQVMPSALLQQTRAVLHSCFTAPILAKKVFSLQFDRSVEDSPDEIVLLHSKLMTAASDRGVVVAPPEAVKSLELKFIELLHSLESTDLDNINMDVTKSKRKEVVRVRDRMVSRSDMADMLVDVLKMWKHGALLLDEVDVLLHPLRSELNFPIGNKHAIDLAGQRWNLPMFLLDTVFAVARGSLTLSIDTFWENAAAQCNVTFDVMLKETQNALHIGCTSDSLQTSPHLVLLDTEYYHATLRPVMAKWASLWLCRFMMSPPSVASIYSFVMGQGELTAEKANDAKMMTLAREWLTALLPHTLSKIDRVGYGLLQEADMVLVDPNTTASRLLTAVPFVGKDVPSRSSEFAHPDVVIGLTTLSYRYEGLRKNDLRSVISQLKKEYSRQSGPRDRRPACVLYNRWIHIGAEAKGTSAESVLPLPLFHLNDNKQFKRLYNLVRDVPELIYYYLDHHVFPATMNFQRLKISACGHELGSNLLFGKRAGFSGTPSNLMPLDFGCCEYEPGSDGDIVHTLTSPLVTTAELKVQWSAKSLLRDVACAEPPFHALIDTGAYITNMDNQEVAAYLLEYLPSWYEGVVFLNKQDRKMMMVRSGRLVDFAQCGIAEGRRFTFYDQIHTTGMDIKQAPTARAVVTIGKDMTFRDYAQGAYRMRGIGKGQTIRLFVIKEVQCKIASDLGTHSVGRPELDVPCWLLLNSMRMENLQAVKLGEQELQNIWRKHSLSSLVGEVEQNRQHMAGIRVRRFDGNAWLRRCVQSYREIISHDIEVGEEGSHQAVIGKLIEEHADLTQTDEDRQRVAKVVADIKSSSTGYEGSNLNFESEVVHEQEAEQEQEQEAEQEEQRETAFSRDDEQHNAWECGALALPLSSSVSSTAHASGESPFYPLSAFRATEVQPLLPFPADLQLTDNFFRPTWLGMGERRLKVAYIVLRWKPHGSDETATSVVSLAEAETLRWMIHTQHAVQEGTSMALITTHGSAVAGTAGLMLPADHPHLLCVRFLNAEMYYSDAELEILEDTFRRSHLQDRRAFFFEALRLRQRQRGMFADTPVERLFTPAAEWHLIRTRGQVEYVGQALKVSSSRGVDVRAAFARNSADGCATPQQLFMLLQSLVTGLSPGDTQNVVNTFSTEQTTFAQFLEAFSLPADLAPSLTEEMIVEPQEKGFWACKNCTFINAPVATTCAVCDFGWAGTRECPNNKWVCSPETGGCSFFNPKTLFYCEVCGFVLTSLLLRN